MRIAFQTEETPRLCDAVDLTLPIPALGCLAIETIAPSPANTECVGGVYLQPNGGLTVAHASRPLSSPAPAGACHAWAWGGGAR